MKATADVLIWWLLPWQRDDDGGGGEGERTENYLSLSPTASDSFFLFVSFSLTHKHTSLTPHQPALQSSRSFTGSVSCTSPSLGQQGGVRHPDSLSRTEACMANYVMRPPLKKRKTIQLHCCYNKAPGGFMVTLQPLPDGWTSSSIKTLSGSSGCVYSVSSGQAQHQG